MALSPKEIMATARVMVRKKAPYLTTGVLGLIPREMPGLGTMAVSENMVLYWDPDYVAKLTPEECMWDLLHEVSHVMRTHAERARSMAVTPELREIWNWAGDAEINDDLILMGARHHVPYITPEKIGCKNGGLAETYYHHLRKNPPPPKPGGGQGQGQGQGGQGGSKPQCGAGFCGSGAGRPIPDEPDTKGKPKDQQGRSPADVQRMRQQVAEAIRQEASKSRGSVPAGWQIWADQMLKPARIPWQQKLARAIRSSIAMRAGAVNYSYSRPSRRQAMYGFGIGKPVLPTLRSPIPRVGVGLDTSGSMGKGEIARAGSEITGILKSVRAEVDFIACDSQVHTVMKLRHPRQFTDAFKGGGGTSFVPVFERVAEMKRAPDVFVFITDGMGDAPSQKPPNVKHVIFVLVGKYRTKPTDTETGKPITWGEHIEIDDDEKDSD